MTENTAVLYDKAYQNIDKPFKKDNKQIELPNNVLLSAHLLAFTTFAFLWKKSFQYLNSQSSYSGRKLKLLWTSFLVGWISMKLTKNVALIKAENYTLANLQRGLHH